MRQFRAVEFGHRITAAPGIQASFTHAGHILGAAQVRLTSMAGSSTSRGTSAAPTIR